MSIFAPGTVVTVSAYLIVWSLSSITDSVPAAAQGIQQHTALQVEQALQGRPGPETADIESLTWESDFTTYMAKECPEERRIKALRRLWTLMPPVVLEENPAF
jgi:hypothetical protein